MLVKISTMYVPIYNRFHTKRANSGKITSFKGVPLFDALVRGEPAPSGTKFRDDKLESLGQRTVKIL